MAELAFLDAVNRFLAGRTLAPAVSAANIGAAEPFVASNLPAVVLSLETTDRLRVGLGDRGELMSGALEVRATIDLADPHLPGDPSFDLLDAARRRLILPHGGQVRADGTTGALSPTDLTVSVGATSFIVVAGVPDPGEVRADASTGELEFGAALPPAGQLQARYFLGTWERRIARISGRLRVDGCAATAAEAAALVESVVGVLLSPEAKGDIRLLLAIALTTLSSVRHQPPPAGVLPVAVAHFRRHASFAFEFQHLIDEPESSGGIIRRIPITTRLETLHTDRDTGAVVRAVATVP